MTNFEKYEHLRNKGSLNNNELQWIKDYKQTEEYEELYS